MTSRVMITSRQLLGGGSRRLSKTPVTSSSSLARSNGILLQQHSRYSFSTRIQSFTTSATQRYSLLNPLVTRNAKESLHVALSTLCLDVVLFSQSHHDDDNILPPVMPLACSSATTTTTTLSTNNRHYIVQRIFSRIKTLIQRLWEVLTVSFRSVQVALRLSPLAILTPAAILSSKLLQDNEETPTLLSKIAWWYFLHSIQSLGPAFVKLAQWAATRRDVFPPNVCNHLSKLHDKGYTHSWWYSQLELEKAFGNDYETKGLVVDRTNVIGCGSAAQVYTGTLTTPTTTLSDVDESEDNDTTDQDDTTTNTTTTTTRRVAIKILHPHFFSLVEGDLKFFQALANLLNALPSETLRMLNLPRVVDNFGFVLKQQADLRVEASNLHQFRHNFRLEQVDDHSIDFPRPLWSSQHVLVEELVEPCTPISTFLQDSTTEGWEIRKELAAPLLNAFLKMVFIDNFLHSDLHPGNVLIQTTSISPQEQNSNESSWWWSLFASGGTTTNSDNTTTTTNVDSSTNTRRTIVLLDAGIATSLSPNDKRNLKDLFRAVILNKGHEAGRLMVERAKYERCSQTEGGVEAFCRGVEDIVAEFHDRRRQGLTLGAVRIGGLLSRVLDLCRLHGVEIDPAMANVVISTLVLEGLGRSLHPDLNLIDCAIPFVLDSARTLR